MLLKGYRKEISRPECNPHSQSINCIARLDEDIAEVLPYLNAALAGLQYTREPPSLTIKTAGKRIVFYPQTNCRECGRPTCMVFATQAAEGGCGAEGCPLLNDENRAKLSAYLGQFRFEG